jgi:prepilin-type N-terminal cleavage/methylation domain-containing protein
MPNPGRLNMKGRTRRRVAARRGARTARRGFSLVEVVVAMMIFTIVMAALGGLLFRVTLQGAATVAKAERMAAFTGRVNQLSTIPYDSLPGRSGCTHTGEPPHERTECVTVVNMSAKVRTVTIVITPDNPAIRPDTVTVERSGPVAGNPFKTP